MLSGPTWARQYSFTLCKIILRCSQKHMQVWKCTLNAMKLDLFDSQSLEQLRDLQWDAGGIERSKDYCPALRATWCSIVTATVLRVPWLHCILSIIFVFITVTWLNPS
jgi:hypothetical protein